MKHAVLGIQINTESKAQILEQIRSRLDANQSTFIVTPYSESIVAAQKDEKFRKVLNAADFALPDGVGVIWTAHYLKFGRLIRSLFNIIFRQKQIYDPIPEKIPGSEFLWDLAELAESRGESIFLLGGFGDTPQIVAEKLRVKFPNLKIAGTHAPSFSKEGERGSSLTELINHKNPDFLFVALGPIRQEKWIYDNLPNLRIKLVMGVGGTFDYIARKRPSPPQILRNMGLEWLWRLLTQPWRVIRIFKGVFGLIWCCWKLGLKSNHEHTN